MDDDLISRRKHETGGKTMSEKLKPCPFCGGEAELAYGGKGSFIAEGISFVRCKECGAVGQKFEVSRKYSSDEKAIDAWNRRIDNA